MSAREDRPVDVDAVTALVEHVAQTVVVPRFRGLVSGEVSQKGPGDVVTVVDTEAEAALVRGLSDIAPGVPVVGEEGVAADPRLLDVLAHAPRAWVVDPLDGTQAFVEGSPDHSVMVALVDGGEAVAGWICLPAHGRTYVAERGSGAYVDGRPLRRRPVPDHDALRGGVAVWAMDPDIRRRAREATARPGSPAATPERLWSGYEYARLASGDRDFLLYWRTWPWDHAPGAVLLREVGGASRRLDGGDYRPTGRGGALLAAADDVTWRSVRADLASLEAR